MNIAVLIKQVPVSNDVSVDPKTHALVRSSSEGMINPADLNAIETAMTIKEETEGKVVVFTMGPPEAEKALREAMAMGCDESCLITDRCLAGGDTIATAKVLAKSIEKYGDFELVLSGALSTDGATGQVGAMVAEYLNIPHVSEVNKAEYRQDIMKFEKRYQDQDIRLECEAPVAVSVCFGSNQPRLATLRTTRAAKSKPLTVYTNVELGMAESEIGLVGSPTEVIDSFEPEHKRRAVMLEGSLKEIVSQIESLIEQEKGKN